MTESLIVEYLRYHDQYSSKFGKDQTIVLMQVGSFYESYATLDKGPNLARLEELTDVVYTKRNNSRDEVSIKNPYMWGFPLVSSTKYIEMLIGCGYHLIIIDQVTPPPDPKRKVVAIYSPGTYLENIVRPQSNYLAGVFIERLVQKNDKPLICCGMASVDLSTGDVLVHESYSSQIDTKLGLDELYRFIVSVNPKETIFFIPKINDVKEDSFKEELKEYLDLNRDMRTNIYFKEPHHDHQRIPYQRKFFSKVYDDQQNMVDILENLEIDRTVYVRHALVSLLNYISDHQNQLIKGLKTPKFHLNNNRMTLGNDAVHQLNIIGSQSESTGENIKYKNLMDCINKAQTNMGIRFIERLLKSPLTDHKRLNDVYEMSGFLIANQNYLKPSKNLSNIGDMERMWRSVSMKTLHPMHFVQLYQSIRSSCLLFECMRKIDGIGNLYQTAKIRKSLLEMANGMEHTVDMSKARMYRLSELKENIFIGGVHDDLDELQLKIGVGHQTMQKLLDHFNNMIHGTEKKDSQNMIALKNNKRDGYYFQTTKKRYQMLEKKIKENKTIEIDGILIKFDDFIIDDRTKVVKMSSPVLRNQTEDIDELTKQIATLTHKYYMEYLASIHQKYQSTVQKTIDLVVEADYLTTIARTAVEYNYTRPVILEETDEQQINCVELRHPIVERLISHEYVPHTVELGKEMKGMLIYGLNSSGKSVLMKAIGLSLCMAQSGFYVPAKSFKYVPYKSLYTRITGNDNLFRGLSSFSLEMVELNAILKRADKSTLVIGDEVCRGTEYISGNALVASSILRLNELGSTFVFATHLHELVELDEIKNNPEISAYHLSVDLEKDGTELIYDRQLKPGSGERIYGITVARYIVQDQKLIDKALEIKNRLIERDGSVVNTKKSKYNQNLYIDSCMICGKNKTNHLETHHINQQKDCEGGFVKGKNHVKKNGEYNLMVVCDKCHDAIHDRKIQIKGYRMTGKGKKLIRE